VEDWGRGGPALHLEPETQVRLYFVMAHYPTTWGQAPLTASLGMQLAVELYSHAQYLHFRGGD